MCYLYSILLLIFIAACTPDSPGAPPPVLDFTGMEQQIVDKIDSLQNVVRFFPDSAEAWGKLGMNLYIHDLKNEAILCFERAARLDATKFKWPYLIAYTHTVLHSPLALDWFARGLPLKPRYAPLYIRYGDALFEAGRIEEAENAYRKAKSLRPRTAQAYLGLARVAFGRGEYEVSLNYLNQSLGINPRHGEAYGLLATVYRRLKMFGESNEAMQLARSLPADTKLMEPVITEMIREGVSAYWFKYRAREYTVRARFHAAIKEYEHALQYDPSAEIYGEMGNIYRTLRRYDSAIEHYRQALVMKPDDLNVMRALYAVYERAGKNKLAQDVAQEIQRIEENSRSSHKKC